MTTVKIRNRGKDKNGTPCTDVLTIQSNRSETQVIEPGQDVVLNLVPEEVLVMRVGRATNPGDNTGGNPLDTGAGAST